MHKTLTYKPFGKYAILIEWEDTINQNCIKDILLYKEKIRANCQDVFADFTVGYTSLTLQYKEEIIDFSQEIENLKSIYKIEGVTSKQENFVWEIPVCYALEFGLDLEEMSKALHISTEKIIQLHAKQVYTVFFIGFLPGFMYLGGLNTQLFFNRKPKPRLQVAKGSVAIGGKQTGVYPSQSAGGWNIIGKTPINFFTISNLNPCFAKPGDSIKFSSISIQEYYSIEKQIAQNTYQLSKTLKND